MTIFTEKVAIVTGSSMGIGKGIARELAQQGAHVVLNGRNPEKLEETRLQLQEAGHTVAAVAGDVSSREVSQMLIDTALERFGRIDFLINNAGVSSRGKFQDLHPDVFQKLIHTNFVGSLHPTQLALPHLKETGGSIVFISALAGLRGLPGSSIYSATKMAQISLAESLLVELADTNVHIGLVYVDITQTEPAKRVIGPDGKPMPIADRDSRSRVASIESVAKAVVSNIRKRSFRTIPTGFGKVYYTANRLFPSLVDFVMIQSRKRIMKAYE